MDFEDVDLESGEDAAIHCLGEGEGEHLWAVEAGVVHARHHLPGLPGIGRSGLRAAVCGLLSPAPAPCGLCLAFFLTRASGGGLPDPWGGRQVQPPCCRDPLVVVDGRPRLGRVSGGTVGLVHHREPERLKLLPVGAPEGGLQRSRHLHQVPVRLGRIRLLARRQRRIRSEHRHRSRPRPQRQPDRVRGAPHPECGQHLVPCQGTHRHRRTTMAGLAPRLNRLGEEVQGGHHHQHPPPRFQAAGGLGRDQRLARPGGGHRRGPQPAPRHLVSCAVFQRPDDRVHRLHLVRPEPDPRHEFFSLPCFCFPGSFARGSEFASGFSRGGECPPGYLSVSAVLSTAKGATSTSPSGVVRTRSASRPSRCRGAMPWAAAQARSRR